MEPTDYFPLAKPIPLAELKTFEDQVDWDMYYGRWGTETQIFSDYYGEQIPAHLEGKATHVWLYVEK